MHVVGKRFLTEDILAGFKSGNCLDSVPMIRRGNAYCINVLAGN